MGGRDFMRSAHTKLLVLPLLLYHFERTGRGWSGFRRVSAFCHTVDAGIVARRCRATLTLKPYIEAGTVVNNSYRSKPRYLRFASWLSPIRFQFSLQ